MTINVSHIQDEILNAKNRKVMVENLTDDVIEHLVTEISLEDEVVSALAKFSEPEYVAWMLKTQATHGVNIEDSALEEMAKRVPNDFFAEELTFFKTHENDYIRIIAVSRCPSEITIEFLEDKIVDVQDIAIKRCRNLSALCKRLESVEDKEVFNALIKRISALKEIEMY